MRGEISRGNPTKNDKWQEPGTCLRERVCLRPVRRSTKKKHRAPTDIHTCKCLGATGLEKRKVNLQVQQQKQNRIGKQCLNQVCHLCSTKTASKNGRRHATAMCIHLNRIDSSSAISHATNERATTSTKIITCATFFRLLVFNRQRRSCSTDDVWFLFPNGSDYQSRRSSCDRPA